MFRERREEIRHIKLRQAQPDQDLAEKIGANGSRRVSDMELFAKMGINPKG